MDFLWFKWYIYPSHSSVDSTLNTTAFAILRYGSTTNSSDPTSSDWSDALGDESIDLVDEDLVPLVTKDAPSTVDLRAAFDSAFGSTVYDDVDYFRFFFNGTTYSEYLYVCLGLVDCRKLIVSYSSS